MGDNGSDGSCGSSTNAAAVTSGDSGNGIDAGEVTRSGTASCTCTESGVGDVLLDASGVVEFDASPMTNLARSLSSRFIFLPLAGSALRRTEGAGLALRGSLDDDGLGLLALWDTMTFRRLGSP